MGMRVVFNPFTTLVDAINQDRQNLDTALSQVSTGRKFNSIGDDPAAAAAAIENNFQAGAVDQFTQSISSVQGQVQAADSALNSVTQALTSAISLANEGANGTLNQSQRNSVAQQVSSLEQEILGLANTQFQGRYVFAGTASNVQPFVEDLTAPSGIRYAGNAETTTVQINTGENIQKNLPGSTIFNGSGADVFQAFHDLTTALQSGDLSGVASASSEIQAAFSNVNVQRGFYGGVLQQLDSTGTALSQEQTDLTVRQNSLLAVDEAQAITNMTQAQTALSAALAATGKVSQNSLLDFLK